MYRRKKKRKEQSKAKLLTCRVNNIKEKEGLNEIYLAHSILWPP